MRVKEPKRWLCWYKRFSCHFSSSENRSFLNGQHCPFPSALVGWRWKLGLTTRKNLWGLQSQNQCAVSCKYCFAINPRMYYLLLLLLLATPFSVAFIPCEAIKKTCFLFSLLASNGRCFWESTFLCGLVGHLVRFSALTYSISSNIAALLASWARGQVFLGWN